MGTSPASDPFDVLIAGAGVAGLEAALALRDLAGERVRLTLLDAARDFVYRPMTVREPFAFGRAERYPLGEIATDIGAELLRDGLASVDPAQSTVATTAGQRLPYDALLLGIGARIHARYKHAITIDDKRLDELMHGLIQDVEGGYVQRVGFVIPAPMAWPFPAYELALMTARRGYDMNVDLEVTVLTPEDAPLAIFGQAASAEISELLIKNGIEVIASAYCEVPRTGIIEVSPGDHVVEVDRVVALPQLHGPAIPGVPEAPDGFVPVDDQCQVLGAERVYAAGDATDFAVKQGGIAAQMADTAAESIAALAGAAVEPGPFEPKIQGMFLTGGEPLYFSAYITGGHGWGTDIAPEPQRGPRPKIAAKYLGPYLEDWRRAKAS